MLSACGIESYWATDRHGGVSFTASLKTQPEDFQVVEVDMSGQPTDATAYNYPTPVPSQSIVCQDGDKQGNFDEMISDAKTSAIETPIATTLDIVATLEALHAQLINVHVELQDIIDKAELLSSDEALAILRSSTNPTTESPAPGTEPELSWWNKEFLLGTGFDKNQRSLLHYAVRSEYLHVRSRSRVISGNDDESNSKSATDSPQEVFAFVDPHFIFFSFLVGSAAAKQIARWSQIQSSPFVPTTDAEEIAHGAFLAYRSGSKESARNSGSRVPLSRGPEVDMIHAEFQGDSENGSSGKEVRRTFHELLRRFYPYLRCNVRDGRLTLRYQPRINKKSSGDGDSTGRGVRRPREEDESDKKGVFTHLVVKKRNMDTMEMRALVAEHFGVREGAVCVAGMKDKRAITWQRLSIPGSHVLTSSPTTLRWHSDPKNSFLDVLHTCPQPFAQPLQVGQLNGNRFKIRLCDIQVNSNGGEQIKKEEIKSTILSRFSSVVTDGFVNYFGQQRFSESIDNLHDHTGLHLFAGRWAEAVRSIYRSMPDVYNAFPERMEARFVPGNSRDAQAMTQALRQTTRMHFSDHSLSNEDVQKCSPLWQNICQRAVCEAVPFALRTLWVHAGQSLFFNVAATAAAEIICKGNQQHLAREVQLPMGGFTVSVPDASDGAVMGIQKAAIDRAVDRLQVSHECIFNQRKVVGVPVPGSLRRLIAVPTDASIEVVGDEAGNSFEATASFYLPSSCYATVCLREVLHTDEWW